MGVQLAVWQAGSVDGAGEDGWSPAVTSGCPDVSEDQPPEPRPATPDWLDEHTLIARILAGDASAARTLYDRHVTSIYRLVYRLAGDDALAQDWTQEAFIRAFDRLPQFRGDSSFATWLCAVATSVALNGLRKVTRARDVEVGLDAADAVRDADDSAASDLRSRLDQAINGLQLIYRAVFVMYDVEGYSHEEISKALGISESASKVRLLRARAMLREQLADLAVGG